MPYEYVISLNRFRDTDTGKFVPKNVVLAHSQRFTTAGTSSGAGLVSLYKSGDISLSQFDTRFRRELKDTFIQQYIMGRGGRSQMTPHDYNIVASLNIEQEAFFDGFLLDIDNMSEAEARNRARLYFQSTKQAYERGNTEAWGIPPLPAYPCDGTSECMMGCKCNWRLVRLKGNGNVDAFWTLGAAEHHCGTCPDRAAKWNPLQIREGVILSY
jgi:hypothetical protein